MSKAEIQTWADGAYWYYLSQHAVPSVAATSRFGEELGLEWIESENENLVIAGWSTLSNWISLRADEELDLDLYRRLLARVEREIGSSPNRVDYVKNLFVISVGAYIAPLTAEALAAGARIGKVKVDMGDTSCKVPYSVDYIAKVLERNGGLVKKKKSVKC
jgi:hypothetical protein